MKDYPRVNAAALTRLTAPERCLITRYQLDSDAVLGATEDLLLVGQLGINYVVEHRHSQGLCVRRWDVARRSAAEEAAACNIKLPQP